MKFVKQLCDRGLIGCLVVMLTGGFLAPEFAKAEKLWMEGADLAPTEEAIIGGNIFRKLAEKLSPAVVSIRSMIKTSSRLYSDFPFTPHGVPPGFREPPPQEDIQPQGEGSGFIIRKDGYILTNAHVVVGSDEVQVTLSDGKLFKGHLVGLDQSTDVALIKVNAPFDLPVIPLGSSDKMKPGDWVMTIGNPFGLEFTVTVGIVSAKGRSLGASIYDDFLQIDAPINPGNSGGPLINTRGEVVGINTLVMFQGQGLGFSLPIDLVKKLLPQLKEKGRVIRSWLGVVVREITLEIKEALNLLVDRGSLITEVVADSPAYEAGIRRNDVIIEFDGHTIKNSRELPMRIAHSPSGEKMPMKVVREGETISIDVVLAEVKNRGRR